MKQRDPFEEQFHSHVPRSGRFKVFPRVDVRTKRVVLRFVQDGIENPLISLDLLD